MQQRDSRRRHAARQKARLRSALLAAGLLVCLAAVGLAVQHSGLFVPGAAASAVSTAAAGSAVPQASAGSAAQSTAAAGTPASAAPTAAPAAEQTAAPTAAPAATEDPEAKQNEAGKAFMEWLAKQKGFSKFSPAVQDGFPYLIAVNRAAGCVTVYAADENGSYTRPYMAMVCSGGTDTPLGYYNTIVHYSWRLLSGPCYGQYATRIVGSYLFHSVPYYTQHQDDLEYDEFNKLGTVASLGCIRLMVVDVNWIYNCCPIGTPVVIYDNADDPGPLGKPDTIHIDPKDETLRGWDPTDPDPRNPWDDKYLAGTTIRSAAAQAEYDAAQSDGRWQKGINQDALQGYSTDSSKVGTRG